MFTKMMSDGVMVFWHSSAVHPHTVRIDVLPGNNGGASWHAHNVLVMRAAIVDAIC